MNMLPMGMPTALVLCGLLLGGSSHAATARAPELAWLAAPGACHALLMPAECSRFRAALAALPEGDRRERYLEEIGELILDRRAACRCDREEQDIVPYPDATATAARY